MPARMVLYVEDELDDVLFMQRAFRQIAPPCHLRSLADGKQAIAYLAGETPYSDRLEHPLPDLVLLDLNLPLVSGFEVLTWVRQQDALNQLPIVVFSSSGRLEDRSRAEQGGANDYITKPASGLHFIQVAVTLHERWLRDYSPASPTE